MEGRSSLAFGMYDGATRPCEALGRPVPVVTCGRRPLLLTACACDRELNMYQGLTVRGPDVVY